MNEVYIGSSEILFLTRIFKYFLLTILFNKNFVWLQFYFGLEFTKK